MKDDNERINDDEVRIIRRGKQTADPKPKTDGKDTDKGKNQKKKPLFRRYWFVLLLAVMALVLIVMISQTLSRRSDRHSPSDNYNIATKYNPNPAPVAEPIRELPGFAQITDTVVNDIPLQIITPRNATPQLVLGEATVTREDASIVLAVKAADFSLSGQGDYHILGDFIAGNFISAKGENESGYCAIIDSIVTIGVDPSPKMFEKAKTMAGSFFRNVALVKDGVHITDNPKGKAYRRAVCQKDSTTFVVIARSKESYHDFAQALADLPVDNAISLLGGECVSGWAVGKDDSVLDIGTAPATFPEKCVNYLVWRSL